MKALVALALLSACAAPALAAETPFAVVAETEGSVMVNLGESFVAAKPGTALRPGDRVMVLDGARAKLAFSDGCPLPLVANSIATVPPASPCAGAVANVQSYGPMYAQAVGSTATQETRTTETTTTTTTITTEEEERRRRAAYIPPDGAVATTTTTTGGRRVVAWWIGGTIAALLICDQVFDCFDGDASR